MNYRPENWEITLRKVLDGFNVTYMNSEEGKLVEAGADAMLEALTGEKEPLFKADVSEIIPELFKRGMQRGYWVFIPGEGKK